MKVLHVTPTFFPATFYGGPIESTYALCNALAARTDVQLKVLTTDAAGPNLADRVAVPSFPIQYPPGYDVYFTRRRFFDEFAPGLYAHLWPMIGWADVVHLTGTYSLPTIPTLVIAKIRGRPVLWSPRGALLASETWAGSSRQRTKLVWERVCRLAMPKRTLLHVTSGAERAASLRRIPRADVVIIPNGTTIPEAAHSKQWRPSGVFRLMFLGRIAPVKGIENLIEGVARLKPGSARLMLYGDGDASYVASLRAFAVEHRVADVVVFKGHANKPAKTQAFLDADLLVLPSFSENFGMVVAESLAHGVPVVVSKGVPWAGVEERGCGRWVGHSPAELSAAIESLRNCDLAAMGAAGRVWMQEDFDWHQLAARMFNAMVSLAELRPGTPLN